jgi:hypothetical protein
MSNHFDFFLLASNVIQEVFSNEKQMNKSLFCFFNRKNNVFGLVERFLNPPGHLNLKNCNKTVFFAFLFFKASKEALITSSWNISICWLCGGEKN